MSRLCSLQVKDVLPNDFRVDDSLYNRFVTYVDKNEFHYESRFDEALAKMEGLLEEEGYSGAGKEMKELRSNISDEMRMDFIRHKQEIRKRIEHAIRIRVQPDSQRLIFEARTDEQVQKVLQFRSSSSILFTSVYVISHPHLPELALGAAAESSLLFWADC